MDRIIKGLTQLKNAFEAVFPAKQNVNFCWKEKAIVYKKWLYCDKK